MFLFECALMCALTCEVLIVSSESCSLVFQFLAFQLFFLVFMLLLRIVRPTATHRSLLLLSFVRCLCAMQVEKITTHHTSPPSCVERHFFAFLESRICVPYSPGERSTVGFLQRELHGSFFTVRTPRLRMTWIRAEEQETQANKKGRKDTLELGYVHEAPLAPWIDFFFEPTFSISCNPGFVLCDFSLCCDTQLNSNYPRNGVFSQFPGLWCGGF